MAALATAAFAALTVDVSRNGRIDCLERRLIERRPPAAATTDPEPWPVITRLGGRPALATMTSIAAAITIARGHSAAPAVLPVLVGVPLRVAVMRTVDRPRPASERWLVQPEGASYPSRHATAGALGMLALRRSLPPSPMTSIVCVVLIAVEAHSRVRLGVHWPSDVVGGVLLAIALDAATSALLDSDGAAYA